MELGSKNARRRSPSQEKEGQRVKDGEGKGNGDENAEERFGIEMYWGTGLLVSSSLESSSVWFYHVYQILSASLRNAVGVGKGSSISLFAIGFSWLGSA